MQVLPRAGSVRPLAREGSVYMDERGAPPSAHREYITVEQTRQPRYRVVEPEMHMQMQMQPPPPQPRYVDAHGREVMPTQQDGEVRYVQRYQ